MAVAENVPDRGPDGFRLLTYTEFRQRHDDAQPGLQRYLKPAIEEISRQWPEQLKKLEQRLPPRLRTSFIAVRPCQLVSRTFDPSRAAPFVAVRHPSTSEGLPTFCRRCVPGPASRIDLLTRMRIREPLDYRRRRRRTVVRHVGSGPLPGALPFAHQSGTWRAPGDGSRDAGRSEARGDSNFLSPRVQSVNPCRPPNPCRRHGRSSAGRVQGRSRDGLMGFGGGPEPRGNRCHRRVRVALTDRLGGQLGH